MASSRMLNNYLTVISEHLKNWKLQLNPSKTEMINIVGSRCLPKSLLSKLKNKQIVKLNNLVIEPKRSLKYLGITFSKNFKFHGHISNMLLKLRKNTFSISRLLFSKYLSADIKLFIYKTYLRSILKYVSEIWLNPTVITSSQIENLRRTERQIIRKAAAIYRPRGEYKFIRNSQLYCDTKIERIDIYLTKANINFFTKNEISQYEIIRNINIDPDLSSQVYPPAFILQLYIDDNVYVNNKLII